jgi:hypothetical protein
MDANPRGLQLRHEFRQRGSLCQGAVDGLSRPVLGRSEGVEGAGCVAPAEALHDRAVPRVVVVEALVEQAVPGQVCAQSRTTEGETIELVADTQHGPIVRSAQPDLDPLGVQPLHEFPQRRAAGRGCEDERL